MGSKNKLKRFKENETFKNVIQPSREILEKDTFELKGQWQAKYFKNDRPIVLELGCGKGEYTLHLAAQNPDMNFIGIDIKGIAFGESQDSTEEKLDIRFRSCADRIDRHSFAVGRCPKSDHLSRSTNQVQKNQTPFDPSSVFESIPADITSLAVFISKLTVHFCTAILGPE